MTQGALQSAGQTVQTFGNSESSVTSPDHSEAHKGKDKAERDPKRETSAGSRIPNPAIRNSTLVAMPFNRRLGKTRAVPRPMVFLASHCGVKTMKLHYQCELCGTIYTHQWKAERCEAFALPPARHVVGEKIAIATRYEGTQYDVVQDILLRPSWGNGGMEGWQDEADLAAHLKKLDKTAKNGVFRIALHEWYYRVRETHQLGKEWWTDCVPESSINEVSDLPE